MEQTHDVRILSALRNLIAECDRVGPYIHGGTQFKDTLEHARGALATADGGKIEGSRIDVTGVDDPPEPVAASGNGPGFALVSAGQSAPPGYSPATVRERAIIAAAVERAKSELRAEIYDALDTAARVFDEGGGVAEAFAYAAEHLAAAGRRHDRSEGSG